MAAAPGGPSCVAVRVGALVEVDQLAAVGEPDRGPLLDREDHWAVTTIKSATCSSRSARAARVQTVVGDDDVGAVQRHDRRDADRAPLGVIGQDDEPLRGFDQRAVDVRPPSGWAWCTRRVRSCRARRGRACRVQRADRGDRHRADQRVGRRPGPAGQHRPSGPDGRRGRRCRPPGSSSSRRSATARRPAAGRGRPWWCRRRARSRRRGRPGRGRPHRHRGLLGALSDRLRREARLVRRTRADRGRPAVYLRQQAAVREGFQVAPDRHVGDAVLGRQLS